MNYEDLYNLHLVDVTQCPNPIADKETKKTEKPKTKKGYKLN